MNIVLDKVPELNAAHWKSLNESLRQNWKGVQEGRSMQQVYNPAVFVADMLKGIDTVEGKSICVVSNLEIFQMLRKLKELGKVNYSSIHFVTDNNTLLGKNTVTVIDFADIQNIKLNMKFDIVIANPPYQKETNTVDDNRQGSFWWEFVKLGMTLVNDNGSMLFVVPTSLFSAGGFNTRTRSKHKVSHLVREGFTFTKIWESVSDYFNVGINICAFIIKKGTPSTCLLVNSNQEVVIDTEVPMPYMLSNHSINIIRKVYNRSNKWPFKEVCTATPAEGSIQINAGRFKKYSKLFVGLTSELNASTSTGCTIDVTAVEYYRSIFKSKLFHYVFLVLGGEAGQSATGILQSLPYVVPNKVYTDIDLYTLFQLTEEEIQHIESTIE